MPSSPNPHALHARRFGSLNSCNGVFEDDGFSGMNAQLPGGLMENLRMRLADSNLVAGHHGHEIVDEPKMREKVVYSLPPPTRCQGRGHSGTLQILEQRARAGHCRHVVDFVLK